MVSGLAVLGLLAGAYLLGSIPTGFLLGKWLKGIDIRQYGSGSTGATNVLRILGKKAAIGVLLIDLVKGVLSVLLVRAFFSVMIAISGLEPTSTWQSWIEPLAGLMALIGHSRSIWINFTGGKSAASGLGVVLALAWPVGLGAMGVFSLVLASTRIVSLGSILAALSVVGLMVITGQPLPYLLFAVAGSSYVILRHRANIQRLVAGQEPRIGQTSPEPR